MTPKVSCAEELHQYIDASCWNLRVQEMRLISALLEVGWTVLLNREQLQALEPSRPFQAYDIVQDNVSCIGKKPLNLNIVVDHRKPWVQIGDVGQPLFFPEWLIDIGAENDVQKDIQISFSGKLTAHRLLKSLELVSAYPSAHVHRFSILFSKLATVKPRRFTHKLVRKYLEAISNRTDVKIFESNLGRHLAGKVVDTSYWNILRRSQFVFCPSGDFGWTYRFYEAILCGACPIVEGSDLSFAEGFFYVRLGDQLPNRDIVLQNSIENRKIAKQILCGRLFLSSL